MRQRGGCHLDLAPFPHLGVEWNHLADDAEVLGEDGLLVLLVGLSPSPPASPAAPPRETRGRSKPG